MQTARQVQQSTSERVNADHCKGQYGGSPPPAEPLRLPRRLPQPMEIVKP